MLTQVRDLWSGSTVWSKDTSPHINTSELPTNAAADVVVIGAGITGAMVAQALSEAGLKVLIVDRCPPLSGSTAATTALLQYEIDVPMLKLKKQIGTKDTTRAWQRSKLALDSLAAKVMALGIDCDLQRRRSLYLAGNILNARDLKKESELRRAAGLYSEYFDQAALRHRYDIDRKAALLSFDNLTANPLQLAAGFLKAAQDNGAEVASPVTIEKVESRGRSTVVSTTDGRKITARFVVHATGYEMPKGVSKIRHHVHSTYVIATRPQPENLWPDQCLIWEASDPYLYVRTLPDGRVICGGEDEPFENETKRDAKLLTKTKALEQKLKKLFPQLDAKADDAWCGSFGTTETGLPTIGRINGKANQYAVLAFGGNGITFSSIAAELLASKLGGRDDIDANLFSF